MANKEKLIQQLANGPAILTGLIEAIPAERIEHDFGPGTWTVHEHVQHLALTQIMFQKRIQLFLREEQPKIVPFNPDQSEERTTRKPMPELLKLYADWRARQVESLKKADESTWRKKALHPEYAVYDFEIAVRHILTHDGFHFNRIEELGLLKPENIKPI